MSSFLRLAAAALLVSACATSSAAPRDETDDKSREASITNDMEWLRKSYQSRPRNLRRGVKGSVRMLITVRPSGKVSKCVIIRSSENAALDSYACRSVVRYGKFEPALDASGTPIEDTVVLALMV